MRPTPHVDWRPEHERLVLEAGQGQLRTVVVRPGIVYGGGRGVIADLLKTRQTASCGSSGTAGIIGRACTIATLRISIFG